jgi:hypothetical protein
MAKWRKLGRIFGADRHSDWMYSHGMIPVVMPLDQSLVRVFFSVRDSANRGHGAYLHLDMRDPLRPVYVHPTPVLAPGALGCFDDSGALPNSLVWVDGKLRLYYTGVNLGVTVPTRNSCGVAEWRDDLHRFERLFPGPIIDRTRERPHFTALPEVMRESSGLFRAWFTSCVRWDMTAHGPRHYYSLEYAESADGIAWRRDGVIAIDFAGPDEYAIAVPRVVRDSDRWRMWFCSRGMPDAPTYRIRYAESDDGITWARLPTQPGLEASDTGWDSEMVCYPFIFDHGGNRYMFYNGNAYGKTGFGLAILE